MVGPIPEQRLAVQAPSSDPDSRAAGEEGHHLVDQSAVAADEVLPTYFGSHPWHRTLTPSDLHEASLPSPGMASLQA